ncbi:hypothetical protein [Mycoplasmopsis agassizii]|uniref:Lipoprotein n=1 Tax=Mycoplasmopsis agassizii TaxID=33922 RepID=A0ABX4H4J3_9BACT|nr:hypothetical protein [Mycoplasmopsis agassizii]PAF54813.1 hypothetical protein CJF60_03695 [Mycoplasmopsis agassizii]SMC19303.1 hypothetical protein SAMN02745179_00881 [Mycoplasmopsis agassizii]
MSKKLYLKLFMAIAPVLSISTIAVACTNLKTDEQIKRWTLETNFDKDINTYILGYMGFAVQDYGFEVAKLKTNKDSDGMNQSLKSALLDSYSYVLNNLNKFFETYEGKITYPASIKTKIDEITKLVNEIPITTSIEETDSHYQKTRSFFYEVRELANQIKLI